MALDPGYAMALDNLTWARLIEWKFGWGGDPEASRKQAVELAHRAVTLDPESADICWTLASVSLHALADHDSADLEYRKAVALNQNAADILAAWGGDLAYLGRPAEGIEVVRRAMRFNPVHSAWYEWSLGVVAYTARLYEEAVAALEGATDAGPWAEIYLAASYAQLGRIEDARAVAAKIRVEQPEQSIEDWLARRPFRTETDRGHLREGMAKAWETEAEGAPGSAVAAALDGSARASFQAPSIAVLPFRNRTGDTEQEDFIASFAEEIIDGLSRFRHLSVIASRSVFAYKDKAISVQNIARELGAEFVISGTVRREDGRLQVTGRLVSATDGNQLWSQSYDYPADEAFAARDQITRRVVSELGTLDMGPLSRAMIALARRKPEAERSAHDHLLLAIEQQSRFTPEGIAQAEATLERSLALDPDKTAERAYALAHDALALDPASPTLNWTMAVAHLHLRQDHGAAEAAYKRAMTLDPNSPDIVADWGGDLGYFGRGDEGIEAVRNAMALNPTHPAWYEWCLATPAFTARRYDDVVTALEGADETEPSAAMFLAASLAYLGRLDEAHALTARLRESYPGQSVADWVARKPYQLDADREHFREGLQRAWGDDRAHVDAVPVVAATPEGAASSDERPAIIVLPFKNVSGDPEEEYFADGITEDITTELSKFRPLLVFSSQSAFTYKGRPADIQEVGRSLSVGYVVEGSVRRAGAQVRIAAQLVETASRKQIWSERYDRDLEDVFAVQDEVAHAIVSTVARRLRLAAEKTAQRKRPANLQAYDYVLRANEPYSSYTPQMNRDARALYEKALALDPHYAQACAYLAVTHLYDREFSWVEPGATPLETGFEYAARSVALDEADAETQSALAYACLHDRQFDRAEFHFDQAVQLNPNDAIANGLKGMSLLFRGQSPEAIETIRRSRDLNPLAPDWDYWNLGIAYYGLDDYVQATAMFNRVANRPSELYALLAACYAMLGREAEAREHMAEFHSRMARDLPAYPGGDRAGWLVYFDHSFPYESPEQFEALLAGLDKAGLYDLA